MHLRVGVGCVMPAKPKGRAMAVTFTLDMDLLTRAAYMAEQLEQEHPGLRFTRFDAIRATLAKHLPATPAGWEPRSKEPAEVEPAIAPMKPTKTAKRKP